MRIGYLQSAPVFGDVKRNLDQVVARLEPAEADLIVLPELFASGYQFVSPEEVHELSEPVPGGVTTKTLTELARSRGMAIVAGLPERSGSRYFNSAIIVGPTGFIGCYRKVHLFFEETLYFTPGDTGFQVWDIGPAKLGVMVCFDWFYPESARTLALQGADIIAHPSNLVLPHCPDAMVTRCLENRVFSVTANRIGKESRGGKPPLTFIGQSEVVTPRGQILHRAGRDQEELMVVDIEPAEARTKRLNQYNDLFEDRRSSVYVQ
ncbi:MAG TPA: nitrilase-related carbon-nitrogen hydrolase [Nitrospiraceae bacterium]|nr:nitrilase-related carbon-nitrogen hydrolase [Nitrospiraceae bacterium]